MNRGTLIGIGVFAFFLLPAWAVKYATEQNRVSWVGAILFFAFLVATGSLAVRASSSPTSKPGPYVSRYRPSLQAAAGLSFLIAELSAIALTYAEPGVGIVGGLGFSLSEFGAILFPVVAKYATAMEPPLSPDSLFKAQSIVTAFLLAGFSSVVAFAIYWLGMPDPERRHMFEQIPQKRPSGIFLAFCALFAIWMAVDAFFGVGEFERTKAKFCLIEAPCYAYGDDLVVFIAALMKTLAVFAFPLGALLMFESNRLRPEDQLHRP